MTEGFDSAISNKKAKLEELKSSMEEIRLNFIEQSANLISQLYEKIAKENATKASENTLKLGKEKLSVMKREIDSLSNRAKEITDKALASKSLWWHLEPVKTVDYMSYLVTETDTRTYYPEPIDKALRIVLGELGKILEKYGYDITTTDYYSGYRWGKAKWCIAPEAGESTAIPYFPDKFDWSDEMKKSMNDYKAYFDKALSLRHEILQLEIQKQNKQAHDLWDSS